MSERTDQRTVFLVHHHLRRGGVTRVMLTAAEILRDAGERVCLLSGEAASEAVPEGVACRVIPQLAYADGQTTDNADDLKSALLSLYREGDIWHLHNHSLGKNPAVTDVFFQLAEAGHSLVLQPHDFAEDGRPANLERLRKTFPGFPNRLYPAGPHIRYAVLQRRDANLLTGAGIPEEAVHLLPNPIRMESGFPPPSQPPEKILYLTRAIRRKNIGEFLYWASRYRGELEFATSLIPENPLELKGFRRWEAFAESAGIPAVWGIGADGRSFREVVAYGDACVSTSVGEGFGMSFLEPCLTGRGILGRNLPEITAGFSADGVDLSGLYTELPVPADAVDADFWSRAAGIIRDWRQSMGAPGDVSPRLLREVWVKEGRIDFGRLDEPAQRQVLKNLPPRELGDRLQPSKAQPLEHNRRVVSECYGAAPCLRRLQRLYADLQSPGELRYADGDRIRDAFLDLETVRLLRT